MNNTQHTPGPWEIVQDAPLNPKARFNIGSRLTNGLATYVCTIKTEKHLTLDGNEEANAHLISAAPDLLSAARNAANVLAALATGQLAAIHPDSNALQELRAAIAKAKGEA